MESKSNTTMEHFLSHLDIPSYVKSNDIGIKSALQYMLDTGNNEMLQKFLDNNVNLSFNIGEEFISLLAYSLVIHNAYAYELLINAGAMMHINDYFCFLNKPINIRFHLLKHYFQTVNLTMFVYLPNTLFHGWTPLHLAVMYNEPEFVKILINRRVDINSRCTFDSWTILRYLLDLHNQYDFIKSEGVSELSKIHDMFLDKIPNIIKTLKLLLNNGTQICWTFVNSTNDENILQYLRHKIFVNDYNTITRILIRYYARRVHLHEFNNNTELLFIIRQDQDTLQYYNTCVKDLLDLSMATISNTNVLYIDLLKNHSPSILKFLRLSPKQLTFDINLLDNVYEPELQERVDNVNHIIEKIEKTKYNLAKILGNRVNNDNIILDKILNYITEEDIVNISNV